MINEDIELLMAKYLEGKTSEVETRLVLDYLKYSRKDRHIVNLAAAGLQCMQYQNNKKGNNDK